MRNLIETERKSIAALYSKLGANIPRHLLPDISSNPWRRYEVEKELIPPCSSEDYEKAILGVPVSSPTEREQAGAEYLHKRKGGE